MLDAMGFMQTILQVLIIAFIGFVIGTQLLKEYNRFLAEKDKLKQNATEAKQDEIRGKE